MKLEELKLFLNHKNLFHDYQAFYGVMERNLGLHTDFEYNSELYDGTLLSLEDYKKVYNYFTELYFYIDKLDDEVEKVYMSDSGCGNYITEINHNMTKIIINTRDLDLIKALENKFGFENKFGEVEKEYIEIEDKKKKKKNYIFGIGVIAVIGYFVFK